MLLKLKNCVTVTIMTVVLSSCGTSTPASATATVESGTKIKREFKMVDVPAVLTSPEQRAVYVIENYWRHFDYADTSLIGLPEVTEQAFVDFIQVLPHTTTDVVRRAIDRNLSDAQSGSAQMMAHFQELYQRYLYDPNSPMRNEDLYVIYLQSVIDNPKIDGIEKIRPSYELELAMKNRVGSIATDFRYLDKNDKLRTLNKSLKGDYTLIFFNNPDCPACNEIKSEIKRSQVISRVESAGRFSIVAIYVDNDLEAWRAALSDTPAQWTTGYTAELNGNMRELYDLRAIPTLYLLDADKRVVLKDQPLAVIEQFLSEK